jgi:cytochrome P450
MVDFEVGSGRHGCIAPLLGDGIFTQDGSKWEHSRKLLAPLIQRSTLPDLELIEKHFQRLMGKVAPPFGGPTSQDDYGLINLKDPLFDLSMEMITEFLLGEPANFTGKDATVKTSMWAHAFAKEFNTAFRWISKRERLKGLYWMIDSKEFRDSCSAARRIVDNVINQSTEALRGGNKSIESYVALAPLLQQNADAGLVRDQFLNLLLAGRDTSGSLLCWIFYSLSREPGLFKSLKAEMFALLGPDKTRKPSKSDLGRMTQLEYFISESMSSTLLLCVP